MLSHFRIHETVIDICYSFFSIALGHIVILQSTFFFNREN